MDFTTYARKPFLVEAVRVTEDNIEEIAKLVGKLQHKKDGTPYIQVNRWKVPNVVQVFPGFWMTKLDKNIRCYSNELFEELFLQSTPEIESLVAKLNGEVPAVG